MLHRHQGYLHAQLHHVWRRLTAEERGQGTVEYVALILLVAGIFAAVVVSAGKKADFGITEKVQGAITGAIDSVTDKKSK
jgi:Flp pilus assembly pilin Flp